MVSKEHGALIKLQMEPGLVAHHSLSVLLQILHVLALLLIMVREDKWISKVDLNLRKKCN